jgi:hypothetical protein
MGVSGLPKYGSEDPICWYHTPVLNNYSFVAGDEFTPGYCGRSRVGVYAWLMRNYRINKFRNLRVVKYKPHTIIIVK